MIKFYCDNCLKEVSSLKEVRVPHYILNKGLGGYVDKDFNRVDKKDISLGFCQECYNKAYESMAKSFEERLFPKEIR